MFTGIIEAQGVITRLEKQSDSLQITLPCPFVDVALGDSIAVNGACLTVATIFSQSPDSRTSETSDVLFFISAETLAKTNLDQLREGSSVNLERALTLNTRLSGHLVQGHVDGKARLIEVTPVGESFKMRWQLPASLSRYCISKGSITLNGVSLTINQLDDKRHEFEIMVIPHTWTHTNLSRLQPGDEVNLEVDLLAKYVERLCQPSMQP